MVVKSFGTHLKGPFEYFLCHSCSSNTKLYFKKPSKTLSEMFAVYLKIPNSINQNILVSSHKILRLHPKLFVFEPRNQICSSKQSVPWFGPIFIKYFFGDKPNYMNSKWKKSRDNFAI